MSTWNMHDRVALRSHPEFVGAVAEQPKDAPEKPKEDLIKVAFDGGGHGRFQADDLIRAEDAPMTDKKWPPSGLETKTPT